MLTHFVLASSLLISAAQGVTNQPTGVPTPRPTKKPTAAPAPRLTAVSIDAGGQFTCAVLINGRAKCWGDNSSGQLGQGDTKARGGAPGDMGNKLPPVPLGAGRTVKSLASGYFHSCAILDDATARCWGWNGYSQLGLPAGASADSIGDAPGEMGNALYAIPFPGPVKSMCAGHAYTCSLSIDGSMTCFGINKDGTLGLGDQLNRAYSPSLPKIDLGTNRTATAITCGQSTVCALLDTRTVKCWGANFQGTAGQGTRLNIGDQPGELGNALKNVRLSADNAVTAISAGNSFVCALLGLGKVKCWGFGSQGQLGKGNKLNLGDEPGEMGANLTYVDLGMGRTAKAIAAGGYHVVVIMDDDTVRAWGFDGFAQCGQGSNLQYAVGDGPGEMGQYLIKMELGTNRTAKAITAGEWHTCVLLDDGSVKCLGYNAEGQAGIGSSKFQIGVDASELGDGLPPVDFGTA